MKYFAIVLLALVCAASANQILKLSDEQKEKIRSYAAECREKEGVTKEEVQAARGGHFENANHGVKCFAHCVLDKIGFITDSTIHSDVIKTKLSPFAPEDKLAAVAEKCNGVHDDDRCETAFKLVQCYYNEKATLL